MRMGINAQRLGGQRLGVARYIEYLLKYWDQIMKADESGILYLRDQLGDNGLELSAKFERSLLRPRLNGLLWELLILSRRASRESDVLFCPGYTMPLNYKGRCVLVIHSVNEAEAGTHPWWYRYTYTRRYQMSARKADVVLVPSHSTKEDILALYGLPEEKVVVIPLGVDDAFRPMRDENLRGTVRRRYFGDDQPFILFVGKLSRRRNIPLLMEAVSLLKKRFDVPHRLLLVGPNHTHLPLEELANELDISDRLVQTDGRFSRHQDLVAIYNAADLCVFPSTYEGFSLPLLEALACGVPTVTTTGGALPEIAGNAAVIVDGPSPETLSEAMMAVIGDPARREALSALGIERAKNFHWRETARMTLDVLRRVAQRQ